MTPGVRTIGEAMEAQRERAFGARCQVGKLNTVDHNRMLSDRDHCRTVAAATNVTLVEGSQSPEHAPNVMILGEKLQVTFFGVRGSTPCNGPDLARYGGNTSCVLVSIPGEPPLIFDMGTGLRYLGATWPKDRHFNGTCLLTHLHWDHTQGLPFFAPLLDSDASIDVYGPAQEDGRSLREVLVAAIRPPLFPINVEQFPAAIRFHDTSDSDFYVGQVRVKARIIPHVGPTLGFRIEWQGRSIAYLSDHQQPYDGSYSATPAAFELASGVDLLIHDSQYTQDEFPRKATWGHCTPQYATWFAAQAGVKRLALFHHDPMRTDDALDATCAELSSGDSCQGIQVVAAREGMTIVIP